MTGEQTFDAVRMILRNAAPDLSVEEGQEVMDSLSEWMVDIINGEVLLSVEVRFPYEQGQGEA